MEIADDAQHTKFAKKKKKHWYQVQPGESEMAHLRLSCIVCDGGWWRKAAYHVLYIAAHFP